MIEPLGDGTRWWLVDGHEVDLLGPDHAYPPFVRAGCLATRDVELAGDREVAADIAALCDWIIAGHPPWGGGCATCRTAAMCATQAGVHDAVYEWVLAEFLSRYRKVMSPAWQARLHALGGNHGAA